MCMAENEKPAGVSETDSDEWVRRTNLYREFMAQRDEILRHKWIESEKAGHDIGFERALVDWISKYRAAWRRCRSDSTPQG
ncbi:MAG: DUF4032 domain-containing protein [Verrucomicrobiae bacterium]|nr:DUF4032 domain-containing protein [Verrucomicrobiae bacterium]